MPGTPGSLADMRERLDRLSEEASQVIAENYRIRVQSRQLLGRIQRQLLGRIHMRTVHGVTSGAAGPKG
jgi:hypothetical protein